MTSGKEEWVMKGVANEECSLSFLILCDVNKING